MPRDERECSRPIFESSQLLLPSFRRLIYMKHTRSKRVEEFAKPSMRIELLGATRLQLRYSITLFPRDDRCELLVQSCIHYMQASVLWPQFDATGDNLRRGSQVETLEDAAPAPAANRSESAPRPR